MTVSLQSVWACRYGDSDKSDIIPQEQTDSTVAVMDEHHFGKKLVLFLVFPFILDHLSLPNAFLSWTTS